MTDRDLRAELLRRACDLAAPRVGAELRLGGGPRMSLGWVVEDVGPAGPLGQPRLVRVSSRVAGASAGCSALLWTYLSCTVDGTTAPALSDASLRLGWAVDPGALAACAACRACPRSADACWWTRRSWPPLPGGFPWP